MNRSLLRHAFILIFLSLLASFFIPAMALPRLGLSAHTIGIVSGVLLIGLGVIWTQFALSARQLLWLKTSWLYAAYVNWLGCLIGAIFGAGKMTPLAASGQVGPAAAEAVVMLMLGSVGLVSLFAAALTWWGLRYEAPVHGDGTGRSPALGGGRHR